MPIEKLIVSNFKGIADRTAFELCPITLFIGANSSGKSSVLHALVSLAQTLKLGNTAPVLVLDEDFAHVHLGRFVEIAHAHSYAEPISIGVAIGEQTLSLGTKKSGVHFEFRGAVSATYDFKSTLRTQDVYVDSAIAAIGERSVTLKRGAKAPYPYHMTDGSGKRRQAVDRNRNFFFATQTPPILASPSGEGRELFEDQIILDFVQFQIERELRETRYLGPFRQSPLRRYPFRGSTATEVGPQGEATITLLASERVQTQDRLHAKQIDRWLKELGLAKSVELARVGTSDLFDVSMRLPDDTKLPIADLGYGLSQVLPVLTQCSFAPAKSTLLFEQFELHLHENAAKKLANVFFETATGKSCRVLIETHSKELVYELLQLIKARKLDVSDLAIYSVQRRDGASRYKRVQLEWDGSHLEVDHPWVKTLTEG